MTDRRPVATPASGVSHEQLARQLNQLEQRRADDTRILSGRFADLEREVRKHGDQLGDLRELTASQSAQLEFLVAAERRREQRADVEHETAQHALVETAKQQTAAMTTKGKVIAGLISVLTALGTYFVSH